MQAIKDLKKGACPMQRGEKQSEEWTEQCQVRQEVQENSPSSMEAAECKLSREERWQVTGQDLRRTASGYKKTRV